MSHNHLQIRSGNSPERVWKNKNFGEKFGLLHFFSPAKHIPVFNSCTDTSQSAQQEPPSDVPLLLTATRGRTDTPALQPTVMETDLPCWTFGPVPQQFCPCECIISPETVNKAQELGAASLEFALLPALSPLTCNVSLKYSEIAVVSFCLRNEHGKLTESRETEARR